MNPFVGAALISAGTSVVNSLFGKSNNDRNISSQIALQREQNAWSERQSQIERDWNSPFHQMQLYQEAGLNPALLQEGSFVPTSSANPSSSPNVMQDNPYHFDSGIDAFNQASQALKTSEERKTEIALRDGRVRLQDVEVDVGNSVSRFNDAQVKVLSSQLDKISAEVEDIKRKWSLLPYQKNLLRSQADFNDKSNKAIDRRFELDWRRFYNERAEIFSRIGLNNAQVDQLKAFTKGLVIDNEFKQDTLRFRVEQEGYKSDDLYWSSYGRRAGSQMLQFRLDKSIEYEPFNRFMTLTNFWLTSGNQFMDFMNKTADYGGKQLDNVQKALNLANPTSQLFGGSVSPTQPTPSTQYSSFNPYF